MIKYITPINNILTYESVCIYFCIINIMHVCVYPPSLGGYWGNCTVHFVTEGYMKVKTKPKQPACQGHNADVNQRNCKHWITLWESNLQAPLQATFESFNSFRSSHLKSVTCINVVWDPSNMVWGIETLIHSWLSLLSPVRTMLDNKGRCRKLLCFFSRL